jgi:hypothetical protein
MLRARLCSFSRQPCGTVFKKGKAGGEVAFNEDVLSIRTSETELLQDAMQQTRQTPPRPDGTGRGNRS